MDDFALWPNRFAGGGFLQPLTPFSRLIYPVPEPARLGIHLTFDLGGSVRFGPDVEWIEPLDYFVDVRRADAFDDEIRRYCPALTDDALAPAYSGIRPKLHAQGNKAQDFIIFDPSEYGIPGLTLAATYFRLRPPRCALPACGREERAWRVSSYGAAVCHAR